MGRAGERLEFRHCRCRQEAGARTALGLEPSITPERTGNPGADKRPANSEPVLWAEGFASATLTASGASVSAHLHPQALPSCTSIRAGTASAPQLSRVSLTPVDRHLSGLSRARNSG